MIYEKISAAFLIAHLFSWYVKVEKHQNSPPGFSFLETVMCLQNSWTQAQARGLSPNSCLRLHPQEQTHKLYLFKSWALLWAWPSQRPDRTHLGQSVPKQDMLGRSCHTAFREPLLSRFPTWCCFCGWKGVTRTGSVFTSELVLL